MLPLGQQPLEPGSLTLLVILAGSELVVVLAPALLDALALAGQFGEVLLPTLVGSHGAGLIRLGGGDGSLLGVDLTLVLQYLLLSSDVGLVQLELVFFFLETVLDIFLFGFLSCNICGDIILHLLCTIVVSRVRLERIASAVIVLNGIYFIFNKLTLCLLGFVFGNSNVGCAQLFIDALQSGTVCL